MNTETSQKWNFDADYIQACNCDFGCPCEFNAPPTTGFCEGVGAWRISQGRYGDVELAGLGLAFAARWPKALHEGNGTACLYVDERADRQQREALLQIATGKAGGMPFEIIVTTFSKLVGPRYVPFQFQIDGRKSNVQVGDAIDVALTSIRNPVTGNEESVRIEHQTGFMFKAADCAATEQMRVSEGELTFSWPNKAAFVTRVSYGN